MRTVSEKQTPKIGKGAPGPGRPRGVPNKVTGDLRAMVLGALDGAGGQAYLQNQAIAQPVAFMALVGKCLPKDLNINAKVTLGDLVREARERLERRDKRAG